MKKFLSALSWVFTASIVALSVLAWFNRQAIYDWWRLRDYAPPVAVERLAEDTTMTDDGRKIFYVYKPQLNDKTEFNQNCNSNEETIVLGCFVSGTGIYLYDVNDKRLDGVKQVTAAHEMLHAAYNRLSSKQKSDVDKLTSQTFSNLNNERIKRVIENYRSRDASVVPNELHSILATEVRDLPDELENYYKQYFFNRQRIVEYAENYESVLTERRNKALALEAQISGIKSDIDLYQQQLTTQQEALTRDRPTIDTQEEVVSYNQRVNNYNQQIEELNALIEKHNQLVEQYKANALEAQELYEAIDSRPKI